LAGVFDALDDDTQRAVARALAPAAHHAPSSGVTPCVVCTHGCNCEVGRDANCGHDGCWGVGKPTETCGGVRVSP
jgi:hypothetical protein